MTTGTLIKKRHLVVLVYIFRGLVQYHHCATWWCAGRHAAGGVAECPTSFCKQQEVVSETGMT